MNGYHHGYHYSLNPSSITPKHGYNASIAPEPFELDKFVQDMVQKECDGYITQCEAIKRVAIILKKYRLFLLQQHNNNNNNNNNNPYYNPILQLSRSQHKSMHSTGFMGGNGNGNGNGMYNTRPRNNTTGTGAGASGYYNNSNHNDNMGSIGGIDLVAIYQQQVYDNQQPMLNLNKTTSMYDFINSKLGDNYSNCALLNDFNHLLKIHNKEYEHIFKYLTEQIGSICFISSCQVISRNNNELKLGIDTNTIQEIVTQQIINKIHCYYLHSFDIGYKITQKELKSIQFSTSRSTIKLKPSISVNDYTDYDNDDDNDYDDIDDDDIDDLDIESIDEKLKLIHKLINKKHSKINNKINKKYKKNKKSNTTSNIFSNITGTNNKYISYLNPQTSSRSSDYDRACTIYGIRFYYWDYYKDKTLIIDSFNGANGFISDWYISSKFNDLKEELLHNKIYKISLQQFSCLYEETKYLIKCNKTRKIKTNNNVNQQLLREYNIPARSCITLNHILSLLLYCNNIDMHNALFSSFKFMKQNNNISELIARHSNFTNWCKYLRECSEIYSTSIRNSDKFYHIIAGQYLFSDIIISFCSPISCTTSMYVGINITKNNSINTGSGLMLQLTRYHELNNSAYFDCKWLSHFVNENEILFFGGKTLLRISSILDINNSLNYQSYISGIHFLNSMLHLHNPDTDNQSILSKKALILLIDNELNKNNQRVPPYIDKLFSNYCVSTYRIIELDIDYINDRYWSFKKQFITKDDSWIDVGKLCKLFRNVEQIIIKDGPYLTDYTFKKLLNFMESSIIKLRETSLKQIIFKHPKEEGISCDDAIKKYYQAIQYRKWDLFHYQDINDDSMTMYFINKHATNQNNNNNIDNFAYDLWKLLSKIIDEFKLIHEIDGNHLVIIIKKYFQNQFNSDKEILIMINKLEKYDYIRKINTLSSSNLLNSPRLQPQIHSNSIESKYINKYMFEQNKYRSFVQKSEKYRTNWTIGNNVKVYSLHHSAWKNAVIVDEIGDILTLSFNHNKNTKIIDRYQHNILDKIKDNPQQIIQHPQLQPYHSPNFKPSLNGIQEDIPDIELLTPQLGAKQKSFYYQKSQNFNGSQRWSEYFSSSNPASSTISGLTRSRTRSQRYSTPISVGGGTTFTSSVNTINTSNTPIRQSSSRVSFRQSKKQLNSSFGTIHHEQYNSDLSDIYTPRTSSYIKNRRSTQATQDTFQSRDDPPDFAPCKGDPFWDYYRSIGDISRATSSDLIGVMKWIAADQILRKLLQNWLNNKIAPKELPYINFSNDLTFNVSSSSIIAFIRQSLHTSISHPISFDITELTRLYDMDDDIQSVSMSRSHSHHSNDNPSELTLNIIGSNILSYLDQESFLNSCLVSRSWLYCARCSRSRSHIKFRLWNALKYLILDSDLMMSITGSNDIISIPQFRRDREEDDKDDDDDDDDDDLYDDNKYNNSCIDSDDDINDILIDYASGNSINRHRNDNDNDIHNKSTSFRRNTSIDRHLTLLNFFLPRIECQMFSHIVNLQFDFTIPSHNKLIYYINGTVYDSYWQTASLLITSISTLKKIDLLFPDPHILLVAYILQNSLNFSKNSKKIIFPSIGIPKSKFLLLEYNNNLTSLRFAVKSLTISSLEDMLNTHFENYYHPQHHLTKYKNHTIDDDEYAKYVYSQSSQNVYKQLDIYKLCRKIIHKPLVFDITNALFCLNHLNKPKTKNNQSNYKKAHFNKHKKNKSSKMKRYPLTSIEELILCDVKCLTAEFEYFLNCNASSLKSISIRFTQKCIIPYNAYTNLFNKHSTGSNTVYSPTPLFTSPSLVSTTSTISSISSPNTLNVYPGTTHNHNNQQNLRIKQTINDLFSAIIKYLTKQRNVIQQHNHQIKKKFKLANKLSNHISREKNKKFKSPKIQLTYANKIRMLSLKSLSFSFPYDIDISVLDSYISLIKFFEIHDCDEICLENIYLDGGCAYTPFLFKSLKISSLFKSQIGEIKKLTMHRILYSTIMFSSFVSNKSFTSSLHYIDLQIIYSDEYDDPYLHNPHSRQPIRELFKLLSSCLCLKYLYLDLIQYPSAASTSNNKNKCVMSPYLDILYMDNFMKSTNIRQTIRTFVITFNELSTNEFESFLINNNQDIPKYLIHTNVNLGQILRINEEFKDEIEQLIMHWFSQCLNLFSVKLIRHIINIHQLDGNDDENDIIEIQNQYKKDPIIDFRKPHQLYTNTNITADALKNNNIAFYGVSKRKKVGDFYKGEVFGELSKILQPIINVE